MALLALIPIVSPVSDPVQSLSPRPVSSSFLGSGSRFTSSISNTTKERRSQPAIQTRGEAKSTCCHCASIYGNEREKTTTTTTTLCPASLHRPEASAGLPKPKTLVPRVCVPPLCIRPILSLEYAVAAAAIALLLAACQRCYCRCLLLLLLPALLGPRLLPLGSRSSIRVTAARREPSARSEVTSFMDGQTQP